MAYIDGHSKYAETYDLLQSKILVGARYLTLNKRAKMKNWNARTYTRWWIKTQIVEIHQSYKYLPAPSNNHTQKTLTASFHTHTNKKRTGLSRDCTVFEMQLLSGMVSDWLFRVRYSEVAETFRYSIQTLLMYSKLHNNTMRIVQDKRKRVRINTRARKNWTQF